MKRFDLSRKVAIVAGGNGGTNRRTPLEEGTRFLETRSSVRMCSQASLSRDEGSGQRHDRHDAANWNAMLGMDITAELGPQRKAIDEAWEEWITK